MKKKEVLKLQYAKILQNYQILLNSIVTYWIALTVGLIVSYITDKLVFGIFSVTLVGVSALITLLSFFQLILLKDNLRMIIDNIEK